MSFVGGIWRIFHRKREGLIEKGTSIINENKSRWSVYHSIFVDLVEDEISILSTHHYQWHAKTALVILLFDFDRKQVTGRKLLMRGGGGSLIQDLQNHEFCLEKGEVIIINYYYILVLRTFPFYGPPIWGLHNIDPPPLPGWGKSNWHKLKEPLKTVWNISLLGGWAGGIWCRRKLSVSCRIFVIILLSTKTGSMLGVCDAG